MKRINLSSPVHKPNPPDARVEINRKIYYSDYRKHVDNHTATLHAQRINFKEV